MSEAENIFDRLNIQSNTQNENATLNNWFDNPAQSLGSNVHTSANEQRPNNNFLGKKRIKKRLSTKFKKAKASKGKKSKKSKKTGNNYQIEKTANLSLLNKMPEIPWDEIEQDDSENPQRQNLVLKLLYLRLKMSLINIKISLLELKKLSIEEDILYGFIYLKSLPVEVSTDASSGDEN